MMPKIILVICVFLQCLQLSDAAPSFNTIHDTSVAENAVSGHALVTITASGGTGTITYSIESQDPTSNPFLFAIDGSSGAITVNTDSHFDFENVSKYTLTVKALDDNDQSNATATFTVTIRDVNEVPSFQGPFTACVNASATKDTSIKVVTATDPDKSDTITYAITDGNTNNVFKVGPSPGEISVAKPVPQTATSYLLKYTATDGSGLTTATNITVTVGNPCTPQSSNNVNPGKIDQDGTTVVPEYSTESAGNNAVARSSNCIGMFGAALIVFEMVLYY